MKNQYQVRLSMARKIPVRQNFTSKANKILEFVKRTKRCTRDQANVLMKAGISVPKGTKMVF